MQHNDLPSFWAIGLLPIFLAALPVQLAAHRTVVSAVIASISVLLLT